MEQCNGVSKVGLRDALQCTLEAICSIIATKILQLPTKNCSKTVNADSYSKL